MMLKIYLLLLHLLMARFSWVLSEMPPNVVIFLADDLGIGDVGCFGNDTIRTPSIDKIAREGVRLTHHLTASAVCTPSRAAFLTGRYPIRTGMVPYPLGPEFQAIMFLPSSAGMAGDEITFAELAKQKGYTTGLIGKWHLGLNCEVYGDACHSPLTQGFDYFYGLPLSNAKFLAGEEFVTLVFPDLKAWLWSIGVGGLLIVSCLYRFGFIRLWFFLLVAVILLASCGAVLFVLEHIALMNSVVMRNGEVVEQPINFKNFTKRLVYEGSKFLEERKQDQAPFLLFMSWIQVHSFLHAGPEFRGGSKHGAYGDEVEEMDWGVGAIVATLERLDLKENTLIYFSSDNGPHLEDRSTEGKPSGGWSGIYRGGKGQGGMDGGIRVPTAMQWSGRLQPGTVVSVPTTQMDLFATLAALWQVPLPNDRVIDGVDIMPLLRGFEQSPPHEFLFHYCDSFLHAVRYTPTGGFTGDVWKAYFMTANWLPGTQMCNFVCECHGSDVSVHDPPLLFNIGKDPSEKHPLDVSQPSHRDILQKVYRAVEAHRARLEPASGHLTLLSSLPRPWLQPCCGGGRFPNCHCSDAKHAHFLN